MWESCGTSHLDMAGSECQSRDYLKAHKDATSQSTRILVENALSAYSANSLESAFSNNLSHDLYIIFIILWLARPTGLPKALFNRPVQIYHCRRLT